MGAINTEAGVAMDGVLQRIERPHPAPLTYLKVAAVLAVITAIEVAAFYVVALRGVRLPVFLLLSAAKFTLVAMFYMHLKFDSHIFAGLFLGGLFIASALIVVLMALFGVIG